MDEGEGFFSCADGSEPDCPAGLEPVIAMDGSTLVCEPELGEPFEVVETV